MMVPEYTPSPCQMQTARSRVGRLRPARRSKASTDSKENQVSKTSSSDRPLFPCVRSPLSVVPPSLSSYDFETPMRQPRAQPIGQQEQSVTAQRERQLEPVRQYYSLKQIQQAAGCQAQQVQAANPHIEQGERLPWEAHVKNTFVHLPIPLSPPRAVTVRNVPDTEPRHFKPCKPEICCDVKISLPAQSSDADCLSVEPPHSPMATYAAATPTHSPLPFQWSTCHPSIGCMLEQENQPQPMVHYMALPTSVCSMPCASIPTLTSSYSGFAPAQPPQHQGAPSAVLRLSELLPKRLFLSEHLSPHRIKSMPQDSSQLQPRRLF